MTSKWFAKNEVQLSTNASELINSSISLARLFAPVSATKLRTRASEGIRPVKSSDRRRRISTSLVSGAGSTLATDILRKISSSIMLFPGGVTFLGPDHMRTGRTRFVLMAWAVRSTSSRALYICRCGFG